MRAAGLATASKQGTEPGLRACIALQEAALNHAAPAAAEPLGQVAWAPPPHMLNGLRLQTAEAPAIMALTVPGGPPDKRTGKPLADLRRACG